MVTNNANMYKRCTIFFFISELMNSDTIRETSLILPIILGCVYFIGKQGLMVIK